MLIVFWGFLYKCIFSIIPFCHHHHSIKNLRNFMCQNEMVEEFKNELKKKSLTSLLITNNEFEMIDFKSWRRGKKALSDTLLWGGLSVDTVPINF